jgi:hypothetical protein
LERASRRIFNPLAIAILTEVDRQDAADRVERFLGGEAVGGVEGCLPLAAQLGWIKFVELRRHRVANGLDPHDVERPLSRLQLGKAARAQELSSFHLFEMQLDRAIGIGNVSASIVWTGLGPQLVAGQFWTA